MSADSLAANSAAPSEVEKVNEDADADGRPSPGHVQQKGQGAQPSPIVDLMPTVPEADEAADDRGVGKQSVRAEGGLAG